MNACVCMQTFIIMQRYAEIYVYMDVMYANNCTCACRCMGGYVHRSHIDPAILPNTEESFILSFPVKL